METTTTQQPTIRVGDYVKIDDELVTRTTRNVVFQVTGIRPSGANSVELTPCTGGPLARADMSMLVKTDKPTDSPILEPLNVGALVTVSGSGWKEPVGGLYVVVKVELDGRSKLFPLGGDDRGRYWSKIPRNYLTVIDPSCVFVKV